MAMKVKDIIELKKIANESSGEYVQSGVEYR